MIQWKCDECKKIVTEQHITVDYGKKSEKSKYYLGLCIPCEGEIENIAQVSTTKQNQQTTLFVTPYVDYERDVIVNHNLLIPYVEQPHLRDQVCICSHARALHYPTSNKIPKNYTSDHLGKCSGRSHCKCTEKFTFNPFHITSRFKKLEEKLEEKIVVDLQKSLEEYF